MNKAAFIDLSNNFNDKHAIYSLTSYLKSKNIDIRYIREKNFDRTIKKIADNKINILLYSAFSMEVDAFIEFDIILKEKHNNNIRSIIGGPGPTYDWNILDNSTIDALCIGEGEYALEQFILNRSKNINNVIFRGENKSKGFFRLLDLDSLPFPDRDDVYKADKLLGSMSSKQFLSGKGCPYTCTYCHNNAYNEMFKSCGKIVRKKSVDYLIDEIKEVCKKYPFKVLLFQDDTFIANKKWFNEFCEQLPLQIGLPYTCSIRANLMDEDTAKALKESGCIQAWWSIESGNDYIREEILKRKMSREHILEAGRLLRKYKIPSRVANMIGLPGERWEEMLESVELNIKVKADVALANIYVPYPSLELTEYAILKGYLDRDKMDNLPKSFFRESVLNYSIGEKVQIQKLLYLFPLMVRFPFFYNNKIINKISFLLPRFVSKIIYYIFFLYNMQRLYKLQQSVKDSFFMIIRYFRDI